jgi:nucleoid DNA-binding protein
MDGREIERLLSLIESSSNASREEILQYVRANRDAIQAKLEAGEQVEIPGLGGEKIVLRAA